MSEKGKIARALDKTRDSGEVIKLVEDLRRAILVYQVGFGYHQSREMLTREAGVAAAVDIQPSRPLDCESHSLAFHCRTELLAGWFKASFDALLKLHQVGEYVHCRGRGITRSQTSPVKDKLESVCARLERFKVDGDAAKDANESRRRSGLYEYVPFVRWEEHVALTRPQNPRGDQGQIAGPVWTLRYCRG